MSAGAMLCAVLARPGRARALDDAGWTALASVARAEQLMGALAHRLKGLDGIDEGARAQLADARGEAREGRRAALWEAELARRCLAPLGVPLVLLKGTAYLAAGLAAGQGRQVGDLDLLVPRDALDRVEQALLAAGWQWAKADAYDHAYYRRWMHELPPLIHGERDRAIDVHHTILPPTARLTPDAPALLARAAPLGGGLAVLAPEDMVVHAALHLFADGDLAGGLRNLWDVDRLLREFGEAAASFWPALAARAAEHGAAAPVMRAARLAHALFETPVPEACRRLYMSDRAFRRRLLARDGWGRETRPATRLAFYVRSHAIRMPAPLLARHLAIKAWRRARARSA